MVEDPLSAIATENANKPSGSSLVVANSSELIVPRSQVPQLGGGSKTITIGSINITLAAGSSQQMAQEVIDILGDRLASEIEAIIA